MVLKTVLHKVSAMGAIITDVKVILPDDHTVLLCASNAIHHSLCMTIRDVHHDSYLIKKRNKKHATYEA